MSDQPQGGTSPVVVPKPGVQTSSFYVWLATLLVGGLVTYLVKGGVIDQSDADAHRGFVVEWLADALADALPIVWLYVVAKLGTIFMRGRQVVTEAKAESLKQLVAAKTEDQP
ncbi:MAG TPA: hypothetical protein VIP46_02680 [Pyrinomonadaceae bacterium]